MNKYVIYILVYLIGFFTTKKVYKNENKTNINKNIQIILYSIKSINKLVVSETFFQKRRLVSLQQEL